MATKKKQDTPDTEAPPVGTTPDSETQPDGDQGHIGPPGHDGQEGPDGETQPADDPGHIGPPGHDGQDGQAGATPDNETQPAGDPGHIGQQGPPDDPDTHIEGNKGDIGPNSDTGEEGDQGEPGKLPAKGTFTLNRVLLVKKPLMKGGDVKAVQKALIDRRFGCGADGANGVYNATTALAVRHFQAMNRLIVNGKVDKFTADALGAKWKDPPSGKK